MSTSSFEQELLKFMREIRNELRIIRYAKQAGLRGAKLDLLTANMAHDVEVDKYDSSIKVE